MSELNLKTAYTEIKAEDVTKRRESVKHFIAGPSTFVAADYGMPVHFACGEGWREYDNRLVPDETEQGLFVNRASDTEIKLAKKTGRGNAVSVKFGGVRVKWSHRGISEAELEVCKPEEKKNPADLPYITQNAWYRDAFDGVDIQYVLSPLGVKENFVLKNSRAETVYFTDYELCGLNAVQDDEKTISLRDENGNTVYQISAPIMQDAKGGFDPHVTVTIAEQEENRLTVRLEVCGEWISEEGRAFPVTVDPGFITSQKYDSTDTSWISSGHPAEVLGKSTENMSVGSEMNGYAKTRALVKLRSLPQLTPGDVVVDARLALAETACLNKMVVYAHRVTSNWSPSTVCWNTGVAHDPLVLDYEQTDGYNESLKARYWDVTSLMRDWYAGTKPNYGIMLISPSEDSGSVDRVLFSTGLSSISAARPVFAITYRHTFGTEKYWTTHGKDLMLGASAYVNDSTGNLVVKIPMASTSGSRLPAEFSLVYNSNASYSEFRPGTSSHITGCGWMASSDCRMDPVENLPEMTSELSQALKNEGYNYALTDSDGTIHYLKHAYDYVYKDEDGLGLSMTWDNSTNYYQVTAKDGTMTEFFTTGKIRRVVDTNGNTRWWQYEGPKFYNIMDGAGKGIKVNYAASGSYTKINSVIDPGGRTASIAYSSNCIAKIFNTAGISRTFEYKDLSMNGKVYKLLTKVYDYDGSSTEYIYEEGGSNGFKGRVKEIRESGSLKNAGRIIKITYNNDNSTTFATTVNGNTVTETYVFDNFGRTKCILYGDGTAVNCDYTNGDSGNTAIGQIYKNNKVANAGNSGSYVKNLLKNQYMATSTDGWVLGGGAARQTSAHALLGNQCAVCKSTDHKGLSYVYQEVSATPGKTYTASAYMHSEGMYESDSGGARVWIDYYNGSKFLSATYGKPVKNNFDRRRVACTGVVPAGANKIRVHFGIETAIGTVYASAFQLEESAVVNDFSMLTNYNGQGNWSKADIFNAGDGVQADGTIRITGKYNIYTSMYEEIPVNKVNPSFCISGKVKADVAPTGRYGRSFGLGIKFYYNDGTDNLSVAWFNSQSHAWQYVSKQLMPPAADAAKTVTKMRAYLLYEHECNTAYFKDIMVTLDTSGTAYTYDNSGNLVSAKDNAKNNASYTFNSANELTKMTDIKNESYTYTYSPSNAHRLTAARSSQIGNGFAYGYNSAGSVTNTKMGTVSTAGALDTSKPYIESSRTYNGAMNHVTSVTDQRGKAVTYTVNENTGLVSSMKLPNNATVSYEYYPDTQFVKKVSAGGASVGYTYKHGDKIGTIARNGFNYEFFYDDFSRISSINAGSHKLITYAYGANRGPVKTASYGNGSTVGYTYDSYGRIIGTSINGAKWYNNEYDLNGRLVRTRDALSGKEWNYTYDVSGRLDLVSGNALTTEYVYDTKNRVQSVTYEMSGDRMRMNYTYGADGRMGTAQHSGESTYTFSYDHLNRLYQKKVGAVLQDMSYVTVGGQKTTTLVENYSNSVNEAVKYYTKYTYDNMGYISKINLMGGHTVDYQYDSLGQLTYCKDSRTQSLMKYTYDANGNLTAKILCNPLTDEELMRESYKFEDPTWKDLLTKFGGEPVTYDAIGNMTNFLGKKMTWTKRQLDSLTMPNGTKVTFTYAPNGLRLSKTVGSEKTEYGYADGRLVYKVVGSNKAGIEYDSEGSPLAMCYNGVQYVYLKNAQGDIIGLRSEKDGKLVFYDYDEWGVLKKVYNEDKSSAYDNAAAMFNPLRFRGYVYDNETKLYYLNSRYYDPMACRYLNADAYVSTGQGLTGNNMFAYCGNNSPLFKDPNGMRNVMVGSTGGCNYNKPIKKPNAPISGNRPAPAPKPNKPVLNTEEKIRKSIETVLGGIYLQVGLGYGLGGSVDLGVNVSAVAKADLVTFKLGNGGFDIGQEFSASVSPEIPGIIPEIRSGYYKSNITNEIEKFDSDDVHVNAGIGASLYTIIGASAFIGWDLNEIAEELDEIW